MVLTWSWDTILLRNVFNCISKKAIAPRAAKRGAIIRIRNYGAIVNGLNLELGYHTTSKCNQLYFKKAITLRSAKRGAMIRITNYGAIVNGLNSELGYHTTPQCISTTLHQ